MLVARERDFNCKQSRNKSLILIKYMTTAAPYNDGSRPVDRLTYSGHRASQVRDSHHIHFKRYANDALIGGRVYPPERRLLVGFPCLFRTALTAYCRFRKQTRHIHATGERYYHRRIKKTYIVPSVICCRNECLVPLSIVSHTRDRDVFEHRPNNRSSGMASTLAQAPRAKQI